MLALERLTKRFRSGSDTIVAIAGVELQLEAGDVLTIIGSNGAGKSTLLNLIAGTFQPSAGRVLLDGEDLTSVPAHRRARRIGRIVQNPLAGTAPSMTVAENLALAAKRTRRTLRPAITRRARQEMAERLARLDVGLEHRLRCPVAQLSGGERQALTVVMATLSGPEVLLLDEPTAALDPRNAALIHRLTADFIRELGPTTLLVTHNMEQAIETGNRLVMMHKGAVVEQLAGDAKHRATVAQLVDLFARRHVTDDELLLRSERACAA